MKTRSILVSFLSSLLATTLLQVAQARDISIISVSDGTYSFGLGHTSDRSPDYYFDFRKRGNRVVGIQYASRGSADGIDGAHYWERTCVEGTIVGNKIIGTGIDINTIVGNRIIGTGVVIDTEGKPLKMSSRSPVVKWLSNPTREFREEYSMEMYEGYSIKMNNGRVASYEKVREYPGYFAVAYVYRKATLSFYTYDPASGRNKSFSEINSQRIPTTCKSLLKNIFNKKYSGGS